MSGKTDLFLYSILGLSVLAAAADLAKGRIFNWLTLPFLLAGFVASFAGGGLPALGASALGALVGLLAFGWMFYLGMMGGGDVKLLMALGAWGGARYSIEVALVAIILGGVFALAILLATGRAAAFGKKMYQFVLSLVVKELEPQLPAIDRKLTLPFGLPISVAAVWVAWADPLERLGVFPWH